MTYRKVQEVFSDLFGLKFVAASAVGFDRQAVVKGEAIYEDLREKIRASAAYNGVNAKARQACLAHLITRAKEITRELLLIEDASRDKKAEPFAPISPLSSQKPARRPGTSLRHPQWKQAPRIEKQFVAELKSLCAGRLSYKPAETLRVSLIEGSTVPVHLSSPPRGAADKQSGGTVNPLSRDLSENHVRHSISKRIKNAQHPAQSCAHRTQAGTKPTRIPPDSSDFRYRSSSSCPVLQFKLDLSRDIRTKLLLLVGIID